MIKGTTSSGFEFELNEDRLKDWRLVKRLSELQSFENNTDSVSEMKFIEIMVDIENLIFDDHGKALENFIASQNAGTVPMDKMLAELLQVLKSNSSTKN